MQLRWRKSSFSADTGACIEVAEDDGFVFLRESDDPDVIVRTTRRKLSAFVEVAKTGEFDDFT